MALTNIKMELPFYGNGEDCRKSRSGDALHPRRSRWNPGGFKHLSSFPLKAQHEISQVIGFFSALKRGALQGNPNFSYVLSKSFFPKRVKVGNLEWREGERKSNSVLWNVKPCDSQISDCSHLLSKIQF